MLGPGDRVVLSVLPTPGWNGATILLWLIGLCALGGAVLVAH